MDTASHTLELLKRFHAEFSDFRREQEGVKARLSSIEQHYATMSGEIEKTLECMWYISSRVM